MLSDAPDAGPPISTVEMAYALRNDIDVLWLCLSWHGKHLLTRKLNALEMAEPVAETNSWAAII